MTFNPNIDFHSVTSLTGPGLGHRQDEYVVELARASCMRGAARRASGQQTVTDQPHPPSRARVPTGSHTHLVKGTRFPEGRVGAAAARPALHRSAAIRRALPRRDGKQGEGRGRDALRVGLDSVGMLRHSSGGHASARANVMGERALGSRARAVLTAPRRPPALPRAAPLAAPGGACQPRRAPPRLPPLPVTRHVLSHGKDGWDAGGGVKSFRLQLPRSDEGAR